ncbi:hypothetical protein [Nocardia abscessus]|uniref:hypothetical protein n=1 Tax=Nocardia abscessus TaxID=120957 RepID=UPI0024547E52|nr:hypothetical protein [Nocardia abscessus]
MTVREGISVIASTPAMSTHMSPFGSSGRPRRRPGGELLADRRRPRKIGDELVDLFASRD